MVLTVPIMVLVAFTVFVGRYAAVHQDITSAARDAARAAAVRQFPGPAQADATDAADATLVNQAISCSTLEVKVDTGQLHPGGRVEVEVRCVLFIADVVGFGMPGTTTVTATSVAVVDRYRGGDPAST